MRAWSSARFTIHLPDGHRFPIAKYARIRDEVVARGLLTRPRRSRSPTGPSAGRWSWCTRRRYVAGGVRRHADAAAELRRLGFPWSPALRERSLRTVQGTVEAAHDALERGLGINLAGGTHHAFPDHGEGFCVFNDVAIAIRVLQREGRITRAAVVDLDVHQGNGTARIFADDPDVFTFSMHGARNYPVPKGTERARRGAGRRLRGRGLPRRARRRTSAPCSRPRGRSWCSISRGADPFAGDRFGRLGMASPACSSARPPGVRGLPPPRAAGRGDAGRRLRPRSGGRGHHPGQHRAAPRSTAYA